MFTAVARRGRIGCRQSIARVGSLVAVLCAACLLPLAAPAGAAPSQSPTSTRSEHISVVQTPATGTTGMCLPPLFALGQVPSSDATTFRLRIEVRSSLCDPLPVTAAIYGMPDDGTVWPQHLLETVPFTLDVAGVTEVTFTRPCVPAQFDVLTGDVPPTVSPLGPFHGPMLFPFDMDTALQSQGCGPTPVVPEAPSSLLLPVSVAAIVGGVGLATVRRRRVAAV